MDVFLTTLVNPFYILFNGWNFFTMITVGIVTLGVIGVFIDIIFKR